MRSVEDARMLSLRVLLFRNVERGKARGEVLGVSGIDEQQWENCRLCCLLEGDRTEMTADHTQYTKKEDQEQSKNMQPSIV